jgi:hypothetical protein
MIRATFTYSSELIKFRRFVVEMSALGSSLLHVRGMQVHFQMQNAPDADGPSIFCKGWLDTYAPWTENPVALTLRVLHTLYTDWYESIPAALLEHGVASMQIEVAYVGKATDELTMTSMSLTQDPGMRKSYQVLRSIDAGAAWPLEIPQEAATPLGIALKLLAFENSAPIDFSRFPPPLNLPVHMAAGVPRAVSIGDIPDYAQAALQRFLGDQGPRLANRHLLISERKWNSFLVS